MLDEMFYVINKNGCWIWKLSLQTGGYGQFKKDQKHYLAHRYFYEEKFGKIPKDKELDHICENKACINPEHLEIVTHAENMSRYWDETRITNTTPMDLMYRKLSRCQLETCRKPLELSLNRGSKRKYCSDAHRKYAWKRRHWTQYLSWQRDYIRRKKYLPQEVNSAQL